MLLEHELASGEVLIIQFILVETLSCRVWKVRHFAAYAATVDLALKAKCFFRRFQAAHFSHTCTWRAHVPELRRLSTTQPLLFEMR